MPEENPLAQPLTIRGAVKTTRTNSKTGARRISLSFPANQSERVAQLSIMDGIEFEIVFTPFNPEVPFDPVTIRGEVAGTSSNAETGERVVVLDFKKSEAVRVGQLSRYDMIVFDVCFT